MRRFDLLHDVRFSGRADSHVDSHRPRAIRLANGKWGGQLYCSVVSEAHAGSHDIQDGFFDVSDLTT